MEFIVKPIGFINSSRSELTDDYWNKADSYIELSEEYSEDSIAGRRIFVRQLDAVDGTPVIDIKPVFREFLPQSEVRQPDRVSELMKNYWE